MTLTCLLRIVEQAPLDKAEFKIMRNGVEITLLDLAKLTPRPYSVRVIVELNTLDDYMMEDTK